MFRTYWWKSSRARRYNKANRLTGRPLFTENPRRAIFSETSTPNLYSILHEYSACVTNRTRSSAESDDLSSREDQTPCGRVSGGHRIAAISLEGLRFMQ